MNKLVFLFLFALLTYANVNGQNGHYDPIVIINPSLSSEHRAEYRADYMRSDKDREREETADALRYTSSPRIKYERHDRYMQIFRSDSTATYITTPGDEEDHQLINTSVYTRNMSVDTLSHMPKR